MGHAWAFEPLSEKEIATVLSSTVAEVLRVESLLLAEMAKCKYGLLSDDNLQGIMTGKLDFKTVNRLEGLIIYFIRDRDKGPLRFAPGKRSTKKACRSMMKIVACRTLNSRSAQRSAAKPKAEVQDPIKGLHESQVSRSSVSSDDSEYESESASASESNANTDSQSGSGSEESTESTAPRTAKDNSNGPAQEAHSFAVRPYLPPIKRPQAHQESLHASTATATPDPNPEPPPGPLPSSFRATNHKISTRERPLRDFKIIVISQNSPSTAFMTIADIVPLESHDRANIFEFVELSRLSAAVQTQIPGRHVQEDLVFRGEYTIVVSDDIRLKYVIKEAFYADEWAVRLFLSRRRKGEVLL